MILNEDRIESKFALSGKIDAVWPSCQFPNNERFIEFLIKIEFSFSNLLSLYLLIHHNMITEILYNNLALKYPLSFYSSIIRYSYLPIYRLITKFLFF